jgi:hypothetical protein
MGARSGVSNGGSHETGDCRDAQFVEMLRAFRRSGGLVRADVLDRAQTRCAQWPGVDTIGSTMIWFEWSTRLWLPWFQFDPADLSLRPGPAAIIAELSPVFDGWDMAIWFARPNLWIADARPIDLIDECLPSVLGAARADRFITAG